MEYSFPVGILAGVKILPTKPDGAPVLNVPPAGLPTRVIGGVLAQIVGGRLLKLTVGGALMIKLWLLLPVHGGSPPPVRV